VLERGRKPPFHEILSLLHFPGSISVITIVPGVIIGPLAYFVRDDFDFTQSDIGTSFATFFLFSALAAVPGAFLVARLGAHRVMRFGLVGAAVVLAGLGLTESRSGILVLMCVGGAFNGVTSVAVSVTILTSVAHHRRGLAFGLRTAGLPSAAAVAGLGGSLVASGALSWRQLMTVTAVLALLAAVTIKRDQPHARVELRPHGSSTPGTGNGWTLALLRVGGLLGAVATAAVTPYFVENLMERGVSPGGAAAVLAVAGWLGVAMRLVVGAVADKIANPLTHLRLAAGCLLVLGSSAAVLVLGDDVVLLAGATVLACGLGFAWPGLWMYAALQTHPERAERVAGQLALGQNSGAVIGPLAFGFLVAHESFGAAWASAGVVAATSAVTLLASVRLLRRTAERSALPLAPSDGGG
jgi:MFS family permease